MSKEVEDLKEVIKKKEPELNHLATDMLGIWKVSASAVSMRPTG
jgi:Crinkler effector protein N-terminal domain